MNWDWLKTQQEGQFFERKSCYDRSGGKKAPRNPKDLVRDVTQALVALANAEGGLVVLGIEDDGTVTGVPPQLTLERVAKQVRNRTRPPLPVQAAGIELEGRPVWVFTVDWSPEIYQLSDGRYLYRHNDQNLPFSARDIEAIKQSRRKISWEEQVASEATLNDLDLTLLDALQQKAGITLEPEELLVRYHLAEQRNGRMLLKRAALLLFGRDPARWHPRCGIDFAVWRGKERQTGTAFNMIKRIRLEGIPLIRLIESAYVTIQEHLPERHALVDLFFGERFAYPTFAWQEAIVNAVAHRDYALEGLGIEIDLFEDRLEVRSPGDLVPPVTMERLRRQERVHASRNPRIARVLTEMGYMRERGEGIPRIFEVMERENLKPPEFSTEGGCFTVTLRSTPIYKPETLRWLAQYERFDLTRNQKRILAYAHEHGGRFTSRDHQKLVGVDLYTASREIKEMIRKGIVRLPRKGGRVYEVVSLAQPVEPQKPPELLALEPVLKEKGYIKNRDIQRVLSATRVRAQWIARKLVEGGWLAPIGEKRGRKYVLSE